MRGKFELCIIRTGFVLTAGILVYTACQFVRLSRSIYASNLGPGQYVPWFSFPISPRDVSLVKLNFLKSKNYAC